MVIWLFWRIKLKLFIEFCLSSAVHSLPEQASTCAKPVQILVQVSKNRSGAKQENKDTREVVAS